MVTPIKINSVDNQANLSLNQPKQKGWLAGRVVSRHRDVVDLVSTIRKNDFIELLKRPLPNKNLFLSKPVVKISAFVAGAALLWGASSAFKKSSLNQQGNPLKPLSSPPSPPPPTFSSPKQESSPYSGNFPSQPKAVHSNLRPLANRSFDDYLHENSPGFFENKLDEFDQLLAQSEAMKQLEQIVLTNATQSEDASLINRLFKNELGFLGNLSEKNALEAINHRLPLYEVTEQVDLSLDTQSQTPVKHENHPAVNEDKALQTQEAQCNLDILYNRHGFLLGNRLGFGVNATAAAKNYELVAAQGDARAQNSFAIMHYYGLGVKKDKEKALELVKAAANEGDAHAQYNVGANHFWEGDRAEAVKFYQLSAAQGHILAQYRLGFLYYHGIAIEKNKAEAARLWGLASEQVMEYVQSRLSVLRPLLDLPPNEDNQPSITFAESMLGLIKELLGQLGYFYDKGLAVEKNAAQAAKFYKFAADLNDGWAAFHLVQMYKQGRGVIINEEEENRLQQLADREFVWYPKISLLPIVDKSNCLDICYDRLPLSFLIRKIPRRVVNHILFIAALSYWKMINFMKKRCAMV